MAVPWEQYRGSTMRAVPWGLRCLAAPWGEVTVARPRQYRSGTVAVPWKLYLGSTIGAVPWRYRGSTTRVGTVAVPWKVGTLEVPLGRYHGDTVAVPWQYREVRYRDSTFEGWYRGSTLTAPWKR